MYFLKPFIKVTLLLFFSIFTSAYSQQTPVEINGNLQVIDNQLCNESGRPAALVGMSSHGFQWYGDFTNYECIKTTRDDWRATVFRAAMYTSEGGYLENSGYKETVKQIVADATSLGMYVIIDWHILYDNDPLWHVNEAVAFFEEMAELYKDNDNVLYEICNEPNGGDVTWENNIKPYAQQVVPAIRAIDSSGIIIVGSANWSQIVTDPARDPLDYENIMYTFHFYAGTHACNSGAWVYQKADSAIDMGLPLFVTEWGTSEANGNGGPYIEESQKWMDWMWDNNLSWCNWSLSNAGETSAAVTGGSEGWWPENQLSESGRNVRNWMIAHEAHPYSAWNDEVKISASDVNKKTMIKITSSITVNKKAIKISLNEKSGFNVRITSLRGRTVFSKKSVNGDLVIDNTGFSSGAYLVNCQSSELDFNNIVFIRR